jgi:ligand-binding SRPBCC domain-containing protein
MPEIKLITEIYAPIERVFDLSTSIDLHKLSTGKTNEEAIAGRTSGLIKLNETVTWRATHFGFRQTLTSKITAYQRPNHFRDEMLKGTFKSICHDHYFSEHDGKTIMTDVFRFESPLGILGKAFNTLVLTNYLKRFLEERNALIKVFAEGEKWREILLKNN